MTTSAPETSALPVVLLVDGRPSTFVRNVLNQDDVHIVLLRFASAIKDLPQEYLDRTAHLPVFLAQDENLAKEAERYLKWIDTLEHVPTYFCNPQEPHQEVAQPFAESVGLPHLTRQQVTWVRHKTVMKDRFAELGLRCAAYRRVETLAEVALFAEEQGWPVVVKPMDSFACIGTYRIDGPDDLAEVPELAPERRWMAEEYIRGTEYQLCALVTGGKVVDAYLSLNPVPILDVLDGAINANITFAPGEELPLDVWSVCQDLVDGFGLDHGYFHAECFLMDDGTLCVGEAAARITGCEVLANHGLSRGFDIHRATLDTYLGRTPDLRYSEGRAVGDLLLPVKPGRVVSISTEEELLRLPGVLSVQLKLAVGDVATPLRASHASSGFMHVAGGTAAEVEKRMRNVLEHFTIETEPVES
ncbi:ATP-grasp domain-containing protein [Streptomyces sp. NBC_01167]|uniref:ATP-grasp domain-containing protein n=1 Tax=Streptomyces sp. NBC_01167 TaxID=2903756 RepID=UPI00386E054C|nr:ATP-grasp domain-containing protein [Streptomyces sp. NBC_01167]